MKKNWIKIFIFVFIILGGYRVHIAYSSDINDQIHITIVGNKNDKAAKNLYRAAVKYAPKNALIQWWDRKEIKQPHPEIEYPVLNKAAVYVCAEYRCSLPAFTPPQLQILIQHVTAPSSLSSSFKQ